MKALSGTAAPFGVETAVGFAEPELPPELVAALGDALDEEPPEAVVAVTTPLAVPDVGEVVKDEDASADRT